MTREENELFLENRRYAMEIVALKRLLYDAPKFFSLADFDGEKTTWLQRYQNIYLNPKDVVGKPDTLLSEVMQTLEVSIQQKHHVKRVGGKPIPVLCSVLSSKNRLQ